MTRLVALVAVLSLAVALAVGPAVSASAAGVAITSPADGATVPLNSATGSDGVVRQYVTLTGTVDHVATGTQVEWIVLYLDGRLIVPPGSTVTSYQDPSANFYQAPEKGSGWTFPVNSDVVESMGATFVGQHTFRALQLLITATDNLGNSSYQEVASDSITITVVPEGAAPSVAPAPDAAGPSTPLTTPPGITTGHASEPSVLSTLPTVQSLGLTPARAVGTAALTVVLVLLVGLPGVLLGSTVSENYERMFGWTAPLRRRLSGAAARFARVPRPVVIGVGILLASIVSGFVDPGFGINAASLRVLASMAVAFVLESLLGWLIVGRLVRRTDAALTPSVEFKALSLLVVVVAVVVSRMSGFEPGFVFGLVIGLSFGSRLSTVQHARIVLAGLGYAFGLAIIGWLGYSALVAALGAAPGVGGAFAIESLSGLAVAGLATLPIALLPLRGLEGGAVFTWRRWVWAVSYAIGMFGFLVVLLPLPASWGSIHAPFAIWMAGFLVYAIVAVVVWLALRRRPVAASVSSEP